MVVPGDGGRIPDAEIAAAGAVLPADAFKLAGETGLGAVLAVVATTVVPVLEPAVFAVTGPLEKSVGSAVLGGGTSGNERFLRRPPSRDMRRMMSNRMPPPTINHSHGKPLPD